MQLTIHKTSDANPHHIHSQPSPPAYIPQQPLAHLLIRRGVLKRRRTLGVILRKAGGVRGVGAGLVRVRCSVERVEGGRVGVGRVGEVGVVVLVLLRGAEGGDGV